MKKMVFILILLAGFISLAIQSQSTVSRTNVPSKARTKEVSKYSVMSTQLYRVLSNHPVSEIRHNFLPKIMTGEILVVYESEEGRGTFFSATPEEGIQLHVAEGLLSRTTRMQQLVLFHEFVHYQQYTKGQMSSEMFDPSYADSHPEQRESFCKQKWHAEYEAYQKECELADRLKGGPDFCQGFQAIGFEEKLASWVAIHDSSAGICKETYSRMLQTSHL